MTGQTRPTALAATLLLGVAWLTSCAVDSTAPPSPAPPPESLPAPAVGPDPIEEIMVSERFLVFDDVEPPDGSGMSTDLAADELWIVAKASGGPFSSQAEASGRGTGSMMASRPRDDADGHPELVPLPLEHTAVDAAIAGHIGTVQVNQRFANPYDTRIEAVYVFPCPKRPP